MTFSEALEAIRAGRSLRRQGWSAGRRVYLAPPPLIHMGGRVVLPPPILEVSNPDQPWGSPWHATSPDLLATDWEEVA